MHQNGCSHEKGKRGCCVVGGEKGRPGLKALSLDRSVPLCERAASPFSPFVNAVKRAFISKESFDHFHCIEMAIHKQKVYKSQNTSVSTIKVNYDGLVSQC